MRLREVWGETLAPLGVDCELPAGACIAKFGLQSCGFRAVAAGILLRDFGRFPGCRANELGIMGIGQDVEPEGCGTKGQRLARVSADLDTWAEAPSE